MRRLCIDNAAATPVWCLSARSCRGYRVHLVDVVPGHVRAALEQGLVTAEAGDARRLTQADASVDAVLLLGPLYHLVGRAERIAALDEARRVLRPSGVLLAAAIGQFMAVLDWTQSGGLTVDVAARWGRCCPPACAASTLWFTGTFFYTATRLQQEWQRPDSPMCALWPSRGRCGPLSTRSVTTLTRGSTACRAAPS